MSNLPPNYNIKMPDEIYDFETGEARAPSDLEKQMIESLIGHLMETLKPTLEKANLDMVNRRAVSLNNYVIGFLKNALVIRKKEDNDQE